MLNIITQKVLAPVECPWIAEPEATVGLFVCFVALHALDPFVHLEAYDSHNPHSSIQHPSPSSHHLFHHLVFTQLCQHDNRLHFVHYLGLRGRDEVPEARPFKEPPQSIRASATTKMTRKRIHNSPKISHAQTLSLMISQCLPEPYLTLAQPPAFNRSYVYGRRGEFAPHR